MSLHRTLTALTAVAFAGAALAQGPVPPEPPAVPPVAQPGASGKASAMFESYDADLDGKVTRGEAAADAALAGDFDGLDRNRDGSLDTKEFARFEFDVEGETETPGTEAPGAQTPKRPIPPPQSP